MREPYRAYTKAYSAKHAIGGILRFRKSEIENHDPFFSGKTRTELGKKGLEYPTPIFFYGEKKSYIVRYNTIGHAGSYSYLE